MTADAGAQQIGLVAGERTGIIVRSNGTPVRMGDTREMREATRERVPAVDFGPALLESSSMVPVHMIACLPDDAVKAGAEFEFDMAWVTLFPKVQVRTRAKAKVESLGPGEVAYAWTADPVLWKRGPPNKRVPDAAFTDSKCEGGAVISTVDGLPISMNWTLEGTYHHERSTPGAWAHESAFLTLRLERLTAEHK